MSHLEKITSKIVYFKDIDTFRAKLYASKNKKVVFTNGCFDLVHKGHVHYLSAAADKGSFFIIGLNTDDSVSKLKGPSRPVKDESTRALVLAAFQFVDLVVIFGEETPKILIEETQPDVLVKGGDYDPSITDENDPKYIVGSKFVSNFGGTVDVIQFVEGESSTRLIDRASTQ